MDGKPNLDLAEHGTATFSFGAGALRTLIAVLAAILSFLVPTASASAAEPENVTHLFNATMSLTGDCLTSTLDPVPDPGCSEPAPVHPPEGNLIWPTGVATDTYGDIYVVNNNTSSPHQMHVDIFTPTGRYINEATFSGSGENSNHENIAVDSTGHLYLYATFAGKGAETGVEELVRFDPTVFNPQAAEIEYGNPPVTIEVLEGTPPKPEKVPALGATFAGLAINPTDDHVFVRFLGEEAISEYGAPPAAGVTNERLQDNTIGNGTLVRSGANIAYDASRDRLYVADNDSEGNGVIKVISASAPYDLIETIEGSATPSGEFLSDGGWRMAVAENEATGEIMVVDTLANKLYVFTQDGEYIETIKKNFVWDFVSIGVDNGALSNNQGYLFAPGGGSAGNPGHLFAYEPKLAPQPPTVESVSASGITASEAVLKATINPHGETTQYGFEYVSQKAFEESGFAGAQFAGGGSVAPSGEVVQVSVPAAGLQSGTPYRIRVTARNECAPGGCVGEGQGSFATFGPYVQSEECANAALRVGLSALLPDCRAYELVTPSDTGGLAPMGLGVSGGPQWPSPPASPDGNSFAYMVLGGLIPGLGGNAAFNGGGYVANRTADGWRDEAYGPDGTQASQSNPGAVSPDHLLYAVQAYEFGSLVTPGEHTTYVRYPDGGFHPLGEGVPGGNAATPLYIASGRSHVIFAVGDPIGLIYDRTADNAVHPISVLPGESAPVGAEYLGASSDGATIAFRSGSIYLRRNDSETVEVPASQGVTFEGLSADGSRVAYRAGGDLFSFNARNDETIRFSESGDVTPVNIPTDGSSAYFLSPSALSAGANPAGDTPQPPTAEGHGTLTKESEEVTGLFAKKGAFTVGAGISALGLPPGTTITDIDKSAGTMTLSQQATASGTEEFIAGAPNLYYSNGTSTRFVGTMSQADVKGDPNIVTTTYEGLGLWTEAVNEDVPAVLGSRSSAQGTTLLFRSREDLTPFKAGGVAEIYRYDVAEGALQCVSCSPAQVTPSGDAGLLNANPGFGTTDKNRGAPASFSSIVPNLSANGRRAFFQTPERLVPADNDNLMDVYEWEANGEGSCATPGGCLFLISSGQSAHVNYLFGVGDNGDDVFIRTTDILNGEDGSETPSVYDARIDGGFPPPANRAAECLGEACQPAAVPPSDPTLTSSWFEGAGNVNEKAAKSPCPKGKRVVHSHGKKRCVAKKQKHKKKNAGKKQGKQTNSNRRTGR